MLAYNFTFTALQTLIRSARHYLAHGCVSANFTMLAFISLLYIHKKTGINPN
jgi:hypothetical protein